MKDQTIYYPAMVDFSGQKLMINILGIKEVSASGKNLDEAVSNCKNKLGKVLYRYDQKQLNFPEAQDITSVKLDKNQFIVMIEMNYLLYKRRNHSKSVSKNVTIPEWLNDLAVQENISFSAVLQEALKNKLGL